MEKISCASLKKGEKVVFRRNNKTEYGIVVAAWNGKVFINMVTEVEIDFNDMLGVVDNNGQYREVE